MPFFAPLMLFGLVDRAPHGVSFGLVLGGRDAEVLTVTPFSSKREVLKLLEGVKAGAETMDVPRALEAAGEVLSGGSHPDKEIVIFGDRFMPLAFAKSPLYIRLVADNGTMQTEGEEFVLTAGPARPGLVLFVR